MIFVYVIVGIAMRVDVKIYGTIIVLIITISRVCIAKYKHYHIIKV